MMALGARFIKIVLYSLLIVLIVISVGSSFWRSHPLELFSNFRVYYLLIAVVLAIALYIWQVKGLRAKIPLYLSVGLIAFNSVSIIPWYLPHSQQTSGRTLRVLSFNINTYNDRWDEIAKAIRDRQPDVAAIIESTVESRQELSPRLEEILPFSYRTSSGGLSVFSRFPLVSPQTKVFKSGSILITYFQVKQKTVELAVTHPRVPLKRGFFRQRNDFLKEMAAYIRQRDGKPLIFLGDFNLTLWSPYYSELVKVTKLHNTRLGFGIEPSWLEAATHVKAPQWVSSSVKIPIDHIFVSRDFRVSDCQTLKAGNSDHRMLWSDLVI